MNPSPKFWDRIADKYSKTPVADEASYQRKLEITREFFQPNTEVLEFGCGTGSTAIAHAPYVKHIRATDISPRMVKLARAKAAAAEVENVTFEVSTMEDLQAPDGSVDVVLGLSILHLLEDKEAAIKKVSRMLKPGGVFVSSTACLGDSLKIFKWIGPIGHWLGLIPMVKVFTRVELETSLTQGGFRIDQSWQPGRNKAVFVVATKAD